MLNLELFHEYRIYQAQDSKDIEMIRSCVQNMLNLRQIQFKSCKSPVRIQSLMPVKHIAQTMVLKAVKSKLLHINIHLKIQMATISRATR